FPNLPVGEYEPPPVPVPPINLELPVITGTYKYGNVLEATLGEWEDPGFGPINYTVQWFADDVPIAGATNLSCEISLNESGKYVTIRVTATNDSGANSVFAEGDDVVEPEPPINTELPVITGTFKSGNELTVSLGEWEDTGFGDVAYSVQWYADDEPITDAT